MSLLDLTVFDSTPLVHTPFDYIVVPGFLKPDALDIVNRDFPSIPHPGNFSPQRLTYGPAFQELLNELNSPELAERFAAKFDVDLTECPSTLTVRAYCEASDGHVHTDHRSKVITALLYFNTEWSHAGGKLRLLRSATDIEDYAVEVLPVGGTLLAFRRTDHSYHGHKRFEGERRMLQLNWVNASRLAQYRQKLDRLSTHTMKRLLRFIDPRYFID
jgi:SM-20-related protein